MNLLPLCTKEKMPACWEHPEVFFNLDLDYDPDDEDYQNLSEDEHALKRVLYDKAQQAAVDVCFGCPIMLACEKLDIEIHSDPRAPFIGGPIGGRTERERKARRRNRRGGLKVGSKGFNPQIAPGDRGPRNQVDDALVARMTKAGKTSLQIAEHIGCSTRTVSRSRVRQGLSEPVRRKRRQYENDFSRVSDFRENFDENSENPFFVSGEPDVLFYSGRKVSDFMAAIYTYLVENGGSATGNKLIEVGAAYVNPKEAAEWWFQRHSKIGEDGFTRVLKTKDDSLCYEDKVVEGARAKVANALDATSRKNRYLEKNGDSYSIKSEPAKAWKERLAASEKL